MGKNSARRRHTRSVRPGPHLPETTFDGQPVCDDPDHLEFLAIYAGLLLDGGSLPGAAVWVDDDGRTRVDDQFPCGCWFTAWPEDHSYVVTLEATRSAAEGRQ